jgi:16S rRNA U1498 N3-methylase RsmE
MDSQDWITGYERRLADAAASATRMRDALTTVSATVTSRDGAVTVTVGPGGGLESLVLGRAAEDLTRVRLAEEILAAVTAARDQVARQAADVVAGIVGDREEALRLVGVSTDG